MDINEAVQLARDYVESQQTNFEIVLLEEHTREEDFGWVFFYTAKDPELFMAGNAPIIIDRETGQLTETGTAHTIEYYIELYRLYRGDAEAFKRAALNRRSR